MNNYYLSPLKPPDGVDEDETDNGEEVTEESGKAFLEQQKKV